MTCWETALAPAAKKARALLGPDAIIYTNECAEKGITEVPPDFDLISVDTCTPPHTHTPTHPHTPAHTHPAHTHTRRT